MNHVFLWMKNGKSVRCLLAALLAVALAAPLGGVPGAQAAKDSLTLAVGGENAEGYDPAMGWGAYGNPLFHSTLLKRDANLNIVKDLAETYSLGDDRLTWTVDIRKDAKFSDGSPLTAEDVAYTFTAAANSGGKVDLTNLAEAKATGPHTVTFTLKKPDIIFLDYLVTLGIVPKKLHGPDYARHPVGSGPYKLVEWDEGQQMIVEANENYYGEKPAIKRLVFLFTDEDASFAAAKAGQADVVGVPSSLAKQKVPGMKLHVVKSVDNRGLTFPMPKNEGKTTPSGMAIGNDVTSDAAIRKAVNYAIDRKALVEGVLEGFGSPAYGVADDTPWDNPAIRIKDADPEKAKAILAEGGWKDADGDGVLEKDGKKAEFTIVYNAKDSLRQGLALAVADMLAPVGIKAVVEGHSWDEIKQQLCHEDVVVYGFGDHSPREMLRLYYAPVPEPGSYNAGFYSNPAVDAHFDKALAAPDFETSLAEWKLAQWDGKNGFAIPGDAAWAWMVNLNHTYFVNECLDVGVSQMEPHGHGWPITANIAQWKWTCK